MDRVCSLDLEEVRLGFKILAAELEICNQSIEAVQNIHQETLAWLGSHGDYVLRQIRRIVTSSEDHFNSTREEVMGELLSIEKSLHRKQVLDQMNNTLKAVVFVHFLRWERFLLRYCRTVNTHSPTHTRGPKDSTAPNDLRFHVLRFDDDRPELDRVRASLPADAALLCVTRLSKIGSTLTKLPISLTSASSPGEMKAILRSILDWSRRVSQRPSSVRSAPQISSQFSGEGGRRPQGEDAVPRAGDLLRAEVIEWMHPSSYTSAIWDVDADCSVSSIDEKQLFYRRFVQQHTSSLANNYLYFCIEESLASAVGKHVDPVQAAMMSELQVLSTSTNMKSKH